jgi:hypothetical protein
MGGEELAAIIREKVPMMSDVCAVGQLNTRERGDQTCQGRFMHEAPAEAGAGPKENGLPGKLSCLYLFHAPLCLASFCYSWPPLALLSTSRE